MTTQRAWKTTIPDIGEITATMTTRQYSDGGRGYLFRFGGAVDDYGKTGFQPGITAAIDDYFLPRPHARMDVDALLRRLQPRRGRRR